MGTLKIIVPSDSSTSSKTKEEKKLSIFWKSYINEDIQDCTLISYIMLIINTTPRRLGQAYIGTKLIN